MLRKSLSLLVALLLLSSPTAAFAGLGDNSVGMNVHDGRIGFLDAVEDLGVTWVRMDANWFDMEPSNGNYNWHLDPQITYAVQHGLKVYLTLAYTPSWVARSGDTDGQFHNDIPNQADWEDFVNAAVTHYSALGVTHFGMWNEPNLTSFFEGTAQQYVDIIAVPGAARVRAACPTCKVLGPDLANVGACDDYMSAVLSRIPANTFDIIAHHIYQGFPETGTACPLAGDCYYNALYQTRFPGFTRRSLRELLDAHGYAGEVWITETGYRAETLGDEELQAVYFEQALDEQLMLPWVTNTFFYEIFDCKPDQPTCDIDGFGILHGISGTPGSRVYPTDFRKKEAFYRLQAYIDAHPELKAGLPPATQCNDGIDNDGDGATDLNDLGCESPGDDNEGDGRQRSSLPALRAEGIGIDGDLGDFGPDNVVDLSGGGHWVGIVPLIGYDDLSSTVVARWKAGQLYLGITVEDDLHSNTNTPAELWLGDSIQLAFDIDQSGSPAYDTLDDHEINFGLANGVVSTYRYWGPNGATDDFEAAIVRSGTTTTYEIRIGASAIPGTAFADDSRIGFTFLINENDGAGREGWLEWTPGIGQLKIPREFGELVLGTAVSSPDTNTDTTPTDTLMGDTGSGDTSSNPDVVAEDMTTGSDVTSGLDTGGNADVARLESDTQTNGGSGDSGCGCRAQTAPVPGGPLPLLVVALGLLVMGSRRLW
ncbi:MAG: hypothetical protein AUK47_04855 [Deltaproteobacteria bacterium CG2_30_63_29]|nr:MAG: hypothetical protein AUK47_04855 [Deltaproteobacteria bacterium CG2_30_63_29]PIW02648.1 MAG: hypothetical protein COW42_00540 [Deltaproteobacteria bacterium CG17_big_fil_post_rev_8_21_14_2_50_63_7]PJB33948.1 MAG: hypothetical protein CO108_29560 [Deltaproteobacteria bacterium CG_4_9_14_3_um_filter_63_12]